MLLHLFVVTIRCNNDQAQLQPPPGGTLPSPRPLVLAALLLTVVACAPSSQSTPGPASHGLPGTSLGWYDELTNGTDKLDVATTVAPISSLARNIGGDRIRLRGLVPDQPTPTPSNRPRPTRAISRRRT